MRRMNNLRSALVFAVELIGIHVKRQTVVVSLKSQHHLSTREARRILRTKTQKPYRHH
jgi:hypothetical protein